MKAHSPEKYEIRISYDFSTAMSFLKMSEKEKGRAAGRHRRKAANYIRSALDWVSRLSNLAERSEIMEKEMCERLETFRVDVEKFVLPRIAIQEDANRLEPMLSGFSKFFADQWESYGMKQLDEINKNVQSLGNPSKQLGTFRTALRSFVKYKPITLLLSSILGFGAATAIILGILTVDAFGWIRSNVGSFILAGTALSALIAGIFTRS